VSLPFPCSSKGNVKEESHLSLWSTIAASLIFPPQCTVYHSSMKICWKRNVVSPFILICIMAQCAFCVLCSVCTLPHLTFVLLVISRFSFDTNTRRHGYLSWLYWYSHLYGILVLVPPCWVGVILSPDESLRSLSRSRRVTFYWYRIKRKDIFKCVPSVGTMIDIILTQPICFGICRRFCSKRKLSIFIIVCYFE
jgi:hypothetical protein